MNKLIKALVPYLGLILVSTILLGTVISIFVLGAEAWWVIPLHVVMIILVAVAVGRWVE